MSVTPVQAECVVAVAETGSFRRASERMFLSQPSMLSHVSHAERNLGLKIFDRSPQGAALTVAGSRILPLLRAFLDERAAVARQAARLVGHAIVPVRVAGSRTAIRTWLMPAVDVLADDFGNIPLEVTIAHGNRPTRMAAAGETDLGISNYTAESRASISGVELVQLLSVWTCVFLPPGHPLQGSAALDPAEFAGSTVVTTTGKIGTAMLGHFGDDPDIRFMSAPDIQMAIELATPLGAAVITDEWTSWVAPSGWTSRRLTTSVEAFSDLSRPTIRPHNPAADALWDLLARRARHERGAA